MAKLFYRTANGDTEIEAYNDPQVRVVSDLETELATIQELEAFSPDLRGKLAQGAPAFGISQGQFPDLQALDDFLEARRWQILDLLDLPLYSKQPPANFNVATDAWFLPEAVEGASDDNGVDLAAFAADAVGGGTPDPNDPEHSTWWQSEINGLRTITFRLRSYPKKVLGIRLRTNASDGRSHLQDVTIKMSRGISLIDDPSNIVDSSVDFVYTGSAWMEHTLPAPKFNCRYIKLEVAQSLHSNADHVRIRSIQAQVGITNHED